MSLRMRFLFVCRANVDWGPTAEEVCRQIAREKELHIEVSSAGISRRANRSLTKAIADQADTIFVMEPDMAIEMAEGYGQDPGKILCLNIPDIYERDDPRLLAILEDDLYEYLEREGLI
jgi:predicted protein tyrosine phosphatase